MAAAAASVGPKRFDVFLSFRGIDTRRNFTSHLYSAFNKKGIVTFMDTALDRGEEITPAILKAIEQSNVSVIIFSKNYASSPWCLDELAKIIECMKTHGQKVLPVFYEIDPADVEKQTGSFGDAFAEYEESFKDNVGKVRKWRSTLTEASYISGWDSRNTSSDSELVEEIIKDTFKLIRDLPSCHFEDLVGIESRIEAIESLLCIGAEDVRIIGIWGMGGIGKTTIAKVIFDKYASHFEGSCFLENVREASSTRQGLVNKYAELVNKLLNIQMWSPSSNFLMNRLRYKKVLIVVDDVDGFEQLELLVGKHCWFGAGSRIIVTSRDKQVLQNKVDKIYKVRVLPPEEALQLFSLFSFKMEQPEQDYIELSNRVVRYVKGIPLALKVLGLFLHGRSKREWESALDRLQKTPNMQIQMLLRISYDGLDHDEQQIFLDTACLFWGWPLNDVTKIFDACGYSSFILFRVLADKALITIKNEAVQMHDLLKEMGRQIVWQESSTDPSRRSRLWVPEDIQQVLAENMGTEAIQGMSLDQSKISGCSVDSKVFLRTKQLKWISFYNNSNGNLQFPQGLEYLPNQLRYLRWDFCPMKTLPSNFQAENLVMLIMSHSPVEQLWAGVQNLANLAVLKLKYCRRLIEIPDLSRAQNLIIIDCQGCTNLHEVSPSIGCLKKLVNLHLRFCKKIKSIPSTNALRSLEWLDLNGCSSLDEFPEISSNIQLLDLTGTLLEKSSSTKFHFTSNLYGRVCQFNLSLKVSISGKCIYATEISSCLLWLASQKEMNQRGKHLEDVPTSVVEHTTLQERDSDTSEKFPSLTGIRAEVLQYERIQAPTSYLNQKFFLGGRRFFILANMGQKRLEDCANETLKRVKILASAALPLSEKYFTGHLTACYEGIGSSVTVQLPSNWFSSTMQAFQIQVFVGFKDENEREIDDCLGISWKCQFKTKGGYVGFASDLYQFLPPKYIEDADTLLYTDNPFCKILDESFFSYYSVNEATFEVHIEHSSTKPCYVVNKVAVNLLHYGDEEGNPPIIRPCCPHQEEAGNIEGAPKDSHGHSEAGPSEIFNSCKEKEKSHGDHSRKDDYVEETLSPSTESSFLLDQEFLKASRPCPKYCSRLMKEKTEERSRSRRKKLKNDEKIKRHTSIRKLKWFKPFWTISYFAKLKKKKSQLCFPSNQEQHFQYTCPHPMDTTN